MLRYLAHMKPLPQRDLALDVFRGLTLALMTIVNRSIDGVSYAQLDHAPWNGLTLTDLVFPSFLFVVGASIAHTLPRYEAAGQGALLRRVLRRTAIIFLCGVLLNAFPFFAAGADGTWSLVPLSQWRIPGVLERIALCYGAASLLLHFGGARAAAAYAALVLPAYALALTGLGDLSLEHNSVLRLDLALLGEGHLYRGYGIAFDPEGILSTFPAVVNALAGWYAARRVLAGGANARVARTLALLGAAAIAAALAASGAMPINKSLWTSTYALCTCGIDLVFFALLLMVVDVARVRTGTGFFLVFGRNTLVLYLFGEALDKVLGRWIIGSQSAAAWIYGRVFQAIDAGAPGALLYALAFLMCVWGVGYALDRRGIYVRV